MEKVDFILFNAKIYTAGPRFSIAESMAIKNGKIHAIGNNNDVLDHYIADKIVDYSCKYIYPGFIDAHCHFLRYGLELNQADLKGAASLEEVIERTRSFADPYPNEWIVGMGWDQNRWENKELPDNLLLNKAFPDRPVILTRIDIHAAIANNNALERAKITSTTKVRGGLVVQKNGKPTGLLIDNAIPLVLSHVPQPVEKEKIRALEKAQQNCFSVGLTSVHDAGMVKEDIDLIHRLHTEKQLDMKIYAMLQANKENLDSFVQQGIIKTHRLSVRAIKLFADGALGSGGADLLEPYSDDPKNHGISTIDHDLFETVCSLAIQHGYQVNTHCIGDAANRKMLTLYSRFLDQQNDLRWRIEHAQLVHPSDLNAFGAYRIIPSVQPVQTFTDMRWVATKIGRERLTYAYPVKSLLLQNGWMAFGSDFPIEEINPLHAFQAAVFRKDIRYHKLRPHPHFTVDKKDALRAITLWPAKAAFEEHEKGSLEPGKCADFVVFSKDIMEISEEEFGSVKTEETFIDGKQVYSREKK